MSEDGRLESSEGLTHRTGFALLTQVSTAAFTAAVTLYLVRALSPASFGDFSLALGIVGLLIIPADLGISAAAGRLMAESIADRGTLAHIFRRAFLQKLIVGGALSLLLFLTAGPVAGLFNSGSLAETLRGMSLALFGQVMFLLPDRAFLSLGRMGSRFVNVLSESAIEAAAIVTAVLAGFGAAGAAAGRGIGYAAGAILGALIVGKHLGGRRALRRGRSGTEPAPLLRFAFPLFIFAAVYAAFVQVDTIILGLIVDTEAVGLFQAPLRVVTFLGFVGLAVASAVTPALATPRGRGEGGPVLTQALRALILVHMASVGFIVAWATPLVDLVLGSDYADSAPVLRALTAFVVMTGIGPLVTTTVHYAGDLSAIRRRIPIALIAIAINIGIDLVLIPPLGIIGAAIGTTIAFAVYLVPHVRLCGTLIPGFKLVPAAKALLRGAVAAAASGAALALLGTGELPLWVLAVGFPVGLLTYVGALLLLKEVSRAELRAVQAWLASRRGR